MPKLKKIEDEHNGAKVSADLWVDGRGIFTIKGTRIGGLVVDAFEVSGDKAESVETLWWERVVAEIDRKTVLDRVILVKFESNVKRASWVCSMLDSVLKTPEAFAIGLSQLPR